MRNLSGALEDFVKANAINKHESKFATSFKTPHIYPLKQFYGNWENLNKTAKKYRCNQDLLHCFEVFVVESRDLENAGITLFNCEG